MQAVNAFIHKDRIYSIISPHDSNCMIIKLLIPTKKTTDKYIIKVLFKKIVLKN